MTLKELLVKRDAVNQQIADLMEPVKVAQGYLAEIEESINAIIAEPVQHVRLATGKDTGTVECLVQGVMVKSQTTKAVVWDQEKLAALRERISQHNDDPDAYMKTKTTYSIDEKRYKDFPQAIKEVFAEARTVKASAPKLTFNVDWR